MLQYVVERVEAVMDHCELASVYLCTCAFIFVWFVFALAQLRTMGINIHVLCFCYFAFHYTNAHYYPGRSNLLLMGLQSDGYKHLTPYSYLLYRNNSTLSQLYLS